MKSNHFSLLKQTLILTSGLLAALSFQAHAQQDENIAVLKNRIDSVLSLDALGVCQVGVEVADAQSGRSLYSHNGDKLFHPASNQKLITTAAGIHYLPSNFLFKTIISTNGTIDTGTLHGDLIIEGYGDPLLSSGDIETAVSLLLKLGITKIDGRLLLDARYFDTVAWGRGWMWDDEPDPTAPVICAISVDQNCVELSVEPNLSRGAPPVIKFEPYSDHFPVRNEAVTSDDTSLSFLKVTRKHGSDTILISGTIASGFTPELFRISVRDPLLHFEKIFLYMLRSVGVVISGKESGRGENPVRQLISLDHPLDSVLQMANKLSDNLAAENLLKTISAEGSNMAGSAQNGIEMVKIYLGESGIDTSTIFIADGSGASWYNAVSPRILTELLCSESRKGSFNRFISTLSVAGIDGTLKNRLASVFTRGRIHAKTGTLTGCNSISGYIRAPKGRLLAFSIMINHCPIPQKNMRGIEDTILEIITRHYK